MGLLSIIEQTLKALLKETSSSVDHFDTGEIFENYVRQVIFPKEYYDILHRTPKHDYGEFIESSLKPDFKFRDKMTKREFYVEAKYRNCIVDGRIPLFKMNQLTRYKRYNKYTKVYILLGFGNDPYDPKFLALIPVDRLKYDDITFGYARQFEIDHLREYQFEIDRID